MYPLPPSIYIPLEVITLAGMASMVAIARSLLRHHRGVAGD